ncbi:N-acetylmuramic acid 6-phosphate etherase [Plakobranchus ocellatus]|uniref:N-acetylmuramic acid 6-phosphate etherase n=1 Tax=Plakobranchus ocellatus TaxID=259542 RepID=A0AAV3XZW1_9GAST|nr:N-acetylmuramic acid 6-phosphate etherase [Plakobranchus ocellatus]
MSTLQESRQTEATKSPVFTDASVEAIPITERPNPLSIDIGFASPKDIVLILCACDQEIFSGWETSLGLQDEMIIDKINKVATAISSILQNPHDGCVVISGCGTSGRLAYLTARRFNRFLMSQGREPCFKYIISGGNDALFSSVELAEDDAREGARRLEEAVEGKTRVVYIGVTCGLSAPFVAGQLDMCLSRLDIFTPVLVGFNPAEQARFCVAIKEARKPALTNQYVTRSVKPGHKPEPIAGSTRMKSGTTTKIILETLALMALSRHNCELGLTVNGLVSMYRDVCQAVYDQAESLGQLIQVAGER